MTEKEIFSKLFDMSSDELYEMFGYDSVEDVVDRVGYSVIVNKLSEPRYGDVYEYDGAKLNKKVIFLYERDGKYILLVEGTRCPQDYTPSNFKAWYIKTGENVADKLRGLFE